jgi:hypothetical protein
MGLIQHDDALGRALRGAEAAEHSANLDAYEATFIDVTDRDIALGRATVLGDVDSFTDWLGADCMNVVLRPELDLSHRCLRSPARLPESNIAQLLFALLTTGDAADVLAARDEIVRRYLDENQKRVEHAAVRVAQGFAS